MRLRNLILLPLLSLTMLSNALVLPTNLTVGSTIKSEPFNQANEQINSNARSVNEILSKNHINIKASLNEKLPTNIKNNDVITSNDFNDRNSLINDTTAILEQLNKKFATQCSHLPTLPNTKLQTNTKNGDPIRAVDINSSFAQVNDVTKFIDALNSCLNEGKKLNEKI